MARYSNCPCIVRDGNSACKTELARCCGCRHHSDLSLLSCHPAIQMVCVGVTHIAYRSECRCRSFPPMAGMDIVRTCRWILRVVIGNSDERESYNVSVGQWTSPELARSAYGRYRTVLLPILMMSEQPLLPESGHSANIVRKGRSHPKATFRFSCQSSITPFRISPERRIRGWRSSW